MNDDESKYEKNDIDNKFDLSVFRTSEQRIDLVQDSECPKHVIETVIEHDLDKSVVLATLISKHIDDKMIKSISVKFDYTIDELHSMQLLMIAQKDDVRRKSFCAVPWNHVSTNANGTVRMCCQMINNQGYEGEEAYGTVFKDNGTALTTTDNISEHRNSTAWKKLRKEMLGGHRSEICKLCWDEEDNGIGSRRTWTNQVFNETFDNAILNTAADGSINHEDFPIEHWDLRFGNKCNLACRSCGPTDSNLWYKDWEKFTGRNTFFNRGIGDVTIETDDNGSTIVKDSPFEWFDKTDLVSNIKNEISNIKRFYFTGGEPTINHTHRELLQYTIDNGYAKDLILDYNTNMAGVPGAIFKQWKEFKEVNLGMSIDGIYEHFEYIRYPGKWNTAYKNMKRIDNSEFTNLKASVTMTVSIMNILHLLDMQWWMREQNWNSIDSNIIVHNLYGPDYLNTQNIPKSMKSYITNRYRKFYVDIRKNWPNDNSWLSLTETRLEAVLTHMNSVEDDPSQWKTFFASGKKLDEIRKENWKESLEDIYKMVQFCTAKEMRKKDVKLATTGKR